MTIKNASERRRKLLKSIAASAGTVVAAKSLPEIWTKPIVNSVMLPAHAQTSNQLSNPWKIQLFFDSGFTDEVTTSTPMTIGSTIYFLITTVPSLPNTAIYGRRYLNGSPADAPFMMTTGPDGKVYGKIDSLGNDLAAPGDTESMHVSEDEAQIIINAIVQYAQSANVDEAVLQDDFDNPLL